MSMMQKLTKHAALEESAGAETSAATASNAALKASLRGQDFDTQMAMLAPDSAADKGGKKGKPPTKPKHSGSAAKGGGKKSTKPAHKTTAKKKGGEDAETKQLLLDQMGREWRAGEMKEYEELKKLYEQQFGPLEGSEVDESDEKELLLDQMGREWRAGEMAEYQDLKKRYEAKFGKLPE